MLCIVSQRKSVRPERSVGDSQRNAVGDGQEGLSVTAKGMLSVTARKACRVRNLGKGSVVIGCCN